MSKFWSKSSILKTLALSTSAATALITIGSLNIEQANAGTLSRIGVNFVGGTYQDGSDGGLMLNNAAAGAPGFEQLYWNQFKGSENNNPNITVPGDNPINLKNDSGISTTADLTWDVNNTWRIVSYPGNDTDRMRRGYLDTNAQPNDTIVVSVSEIPYALYDVVVYFGSDGNDGLGQVSVGNSNIYFLSENSSAPGYTFSPLVQATATNSDSAIRSHYALFSNLSDSNLTISLKDFGPNVGLQGFQIVQKQVPEPASVLGLLALGALGTGSALRRKKQELVKQ